ncbi:MAG: DUF2971 domain-containing protein [Proteobacteria bacterium]|nr:DUF2971 domain-containing protein [Pseudomonadota bacterium]
MLENKALYFSRASHLTEDDPYEGLYPQGQVEAIIRGWAEEIAKDDAHSRSIQEIEADLRDQDLPQFSSNWLQANFLVNGWYLGQQESMAMWRLYAADLQGVVIVSTYKRLRKAFTEDHPGVHIGMVRYDDGARPAGNAFYPITYKRKAFEHEQELRAVVWTIGRYRLSDEAEETFAEIEIADEAPGADINVDLEMLIQEIRTPPGCPAWFHSAIVAVVNRYNDAHGLSISVSRSELESF